MVEYIYVWLNNKDTCQYNFIRIFPDKCFGFRLELVDEFTEIVPRAFGHFISHFQM